MPGPSRSPRRPREPNRTSWDRVAGWYDGWVGERGSRYHRGLAIPTVLDLLQPGQGEEILDVGAGQGVLAPYVVERGARYTGVDASPRLVDAARRRHRERGRFLVGDATRLEQVTELRAGSFDGAVFMLCIQDMDPLEPVVAGVARLLAARARVVLLMSHPAFRQPRHSGWGFDPGRKLRFRRIDSYLTPMVVPMKELAGQQPTRAFHRPISTYVNAFAEAGFLTDAMVELPDLPPGERPRRAAGAVGAGATAADRADAEIPMFLGLRVVR